ncbi:hypothetical protein ACSBR2_039779 [Camellia fascicularis]
MFGLRKISNLEYSFILGEMRLSGWIFLAISWALVSLEGAASHRDQPLSRIAIDRAVSAPEDRAFVKPSPSVLGLRGQNTEWVTLEYSIPTHQLVTRLVYFLLPISVLPPVFWKIQELVLHSCARHLLRFCAVLLFYEILLWILRLLHPYQYANYTNPKYKDNGKGMLKLQLIKQRSDFSFALFSGGLSNPKLVAVSNTITFANPNSPVYPRLAQGKMWNEMTVTWTSGYGINEAEPFVEWGPQGGEQRQSPAGTLTFDRNSMCDAPARTVGWRDPGFIHTSFLKELWPNSAYTYRLGHRLFNDTYIWSPHYQFRASPYPGQNSPQRVVIFGDMGKDEADGPNEYNNFQHGSLNTTKQLI